MAVDLWPYSQRESGRVTDLEHEALWTPIADGILPGESSTALQVSVAGGSWTVNPGRIHIAGHVLNVTELETGTVPPPASLTRHCVVAAYVDRTSSPWTYGIRLIQGGPGGTRPIPQRSRTGRYEVALGTFTVSPSGAVSAVTDDRIFLTPAGIALPPSKQVADSTDFNWSSDQWSNGDPVVGTEFVAPPSGKVKVEVFYYGQGTSNALLVTAFSIRQGSSAGPVVYNNTTYDGPILSSNAAQTVSKIVSGLTPWQTYYIRLAHRSTQNGVPVVIRHRRLSVEPLVS